MECKFLRLKGQHKQRSKAREVQTIFGYGEKQTIVCLERDTDYL